MKEKIASLTAYKYANMIDKEISSTPNQNEKKGKIMIASQLYFYAGENGLKYLLELSDVPLSRDTLQNQVLTQLSKIFDKETSERIEELYLLLLPKKDGGSGFRNLGAYQGKNSNIYNTHKEFAKLIVEAIENNTED